MNMQYVAYDSTKERTSEKTVFFTIYAPQVFQSLFLTPKSVAEQLSAKPDIFIVFLVPHGDIATLIEKSDIGKKENVKIEIIERMPKRTLIQEIFYFFYSYLMFTGTTKLLATFGARLDAPLAGANRHFAMVKRFIAHTFGRSHVIKTKIVPWLYFRIFNARPYRRVFDRYHPDLVFVSNIAHFPDTEILAEAKRRNIKTAGMPSNWDHLNKYYIPIHSDMLLIQNEPMRKEAMVLHAYRSEQIVMVGFPQMDVYFEKSFYWSREVFLEKIGLPPGSKFIFFISGSVYYLDEPDILRAIARWLEKGEFGEHVYLLMRPYPQRIEKEKYKEFGYNKHIVISWDKIWYDLENYYYYLNILEHASLVISLFSTSAIEAAIFDKPLITIGFDGYKKRSYHESIVRLEDLSHFRHVLDTGSVKVARSFDELQSLIKEYFDHPEKDRELRKKLVDRMCYKLDGQASKRVVDTLTRALYEKT